MKRSEFLAKSSRIKTSNEWLAYYTANAEDQLEIPWERGAEVTQTELDSFANSLQAWQLGETSDGSHLLATTQKYAEVVDDPLLIDVVDLFIKEEQRHGQNLGRFLDLAGVPRISRNWGDSSFRSIRYFLLNMELWATSVVMVETIAMIYYNALRNITQSSVLRLICKQILRDEVAHIRFQCERLAALHHKRPRLLLSLTYLLQHILFLGIIFAVWFGHHKALRAGGHNFKSFWGTAWSKMNLAWQQMNPRQYEWDPVVSEQLFSPVE